MSSIPLGSRIVCDGEYGTVLYVGEIESIHGIWLGIEWDNPERGKHDGSYNGVNYFKTRNPKGGSFIRPEKAKIGRPCPEAILERYLDNKDALDESNMSLPQKYGKKRIIEFIGLEKITTKQSQLDQIETVDLSSMFISGPGQPGILFDLIPNVTSMILSKNLFTSWNMIADITIQLPYLTVLNISENKLVLPENPIELKAAFRNIKTLILNKMCYDWSQFMMCAVMWPDIEYLDLWSNRISNITEIPSDIFIYLQSLNLSDNPIGNWEEICKLGKLPRLKKLIVENAKIPSISLPTIKSSTSNGLFDNLKCLYLTNNELSEWKHIAELHKLQNLEELKIKGNPVMSLETLETSHQIVIAKLHSLKCLNGLMITKEDRRGAELDYLKKYCEEWLKSGGHRDPELNKPSCEFLNEHPTYLKLLKEYGAPEDSELKKTSELLKNNLISVEIYCPISPDKKPIAKKLPAMMTVGKVKTLACRLFNQNIQDIILWVVSSKENEPEIEMDNDLREISFYSVRNGDKIYIR